MAKKWFASCLFFEHFRLLSRFFVNWILSPTHYKSQKSILTAPRIPIPLKNGPALKCIECQSLVLDSALSAAPLTDISLPQWRLNVYLCHFFDRLTLVTQDKPGCTLCVQPIPLPCLIFFTALINIWIYIFSIYLQIYLILAYSNENRGCIFLEHHCIWVGAQQVACT